jgi:hypothetical protein
MGVAAIGITRLRIRRVPLNLCDELGTSGFDAANGRTDEVGDEVMLLTYRKMHAKSNGSKGDGSRYTVPKVRLLKGLQKRKPLNDPINTGYQAITHGGQYAAFYLLDWRINH